MSIHALSWAWKQDVSPTDKLVLLALADHSDDTGYCWPGINGVAEKCKIAIRSVFRAVSRLEQRGLVHREPRFRENGSQASNGYTLFVPPLTHSHPPPDYLSSPPLTHSHPLNHQIEPSLKKEKTLAHQAAREGFDIFWKAYPRKKSKGDAEKAWKAIRPTKDLLSTILAAIDRAKASADWTKDGGKYIPYPATWLNAKGWDDEESTSPDPTPDPDEINYRFNKDGALETLTRRELDAEKKALLALEHVAQ